MRTNRDHLTLADLRDELAATRKELAEFREELFYFLGRFQSAVVSAVQSNPTQLNR